ncbi:MAG: AbrB/MazE/SpoVT family DNA-binding domain-containing protein [Chloroflexota bacterium]
MKEQYTVVTRKGQITVPAEIRKALGLAVGDRVAVSLGEDGQMQATLRPLASVADATFGGIASGRHDADEQAVTRAVAEHAAARDVRSKRS